MASGFSVEVSSRRVELHPLLYKETLPGSPSSWTALGFSLQEQLPKDAPELASPLNLRWSGRPSSEPKDVLAVVSDLEGYELKRQAALASQPNTLVKGFYMLPKYHDIHSIVLRLYHCRVSSKGKDRFTHPEEVEQTPFLNYLLHFFKSDSSAPSAAQLRKESTAMDRTLTQTFSVSLLHIRADSSSALANTARPPRALVPRQREVTSSEPDLFPSVASISPHHQGNKADAVVFLDSGAGKGKANRRMSTQFVQKLLGRSPEEQQRGQEVPSSPPPKDWSSEHDDEEEPDEEEESERESSEDLHAADEDDEDDFDSEAERQNDYEAVRLMKLHQNAMDRQRERLEREARIQAEEEVDEDEDEESDSGSQGRPSPYNFDNSLAHIDTEHSCTSPHEEPPVQSLKFFPSTATANQAATEAPAAAVASTSAVQAIGEPATAEPSASQALPQGDQLTDYIASRDYFFPYAHHAKDKGFNETDSQVLIAYLKKRAVILRAQAQQYAGRESFADIERDLLREADHAELQVLNIYYSHVVKVREQSGKRSLPELLGDSTADGPAMKRLRL